MELATAFGMALKEIRKRQALTQEDFSELSSRTYLSSLERGLKSPTIEKLDQLAQVLEVHPVTILLAAYLRKEEGVTQLQLEARIHEELKNFLS